LIPLYGRLSDWLQPWIKSTTLAPGVSRPRVVGIDSLTGHWQLASVIVGLPLLQSHVSIARKDALVQIQRYVQF